MKVMTILVPDGENNLSSIVGAYKLFSRANEFWEKNGRKPVFRIVLAGLSEEVDFYQGIFTVKPHKHVSEIKKAHLIIIPSLNHQYQKAIKANGSMIDWLTKQYHQGAEIASICTGAFLLASTGLLDGRTCSTHWAAADQLKTLFPRVRLQTDQVVTDENGIYTNGGAYSFLNLLIYLIEKYYDRTTAIYCAKVFQIDIERSSQSPFSIFSGQKSHGDDLVKKAQTYFEKNVHEKISVEKLSAELAVGRRNFDRRFIRATGNTPIEYLQRVKVESAKKALESSSMTVQEVMYDSGYSDAKAFREIFRRITGLSPLNYKRRYNKRTTIADK